MRLGTTQSPKSRDPLPKATEGRSGAKPNGSAPTAQTSRASQGNPAISWPSAPFDAKGRSYDLWGTTDLFSAARQEPIAHHGAPIGVEPGSPTHFQSRRNQLTGEANQAHIAHLTYPQDKDLQQAFRHAKSAEEAFIHDNRHNIQQEIKAGHKDEYVPPRDFRPPSLGFDGAPHSPSIPGYHHPRPLHRDTLVRLDDMVNKAATAFVNRPGKGTEKAYKEALNARTVYEKAHKGEIEREMRSGAWAQPPVGWNHSDYRELKMRDRNTVAESNPVVGNRVYELGVPPYRSEAG